VGLLLLRICSEKEMANLFILKENLIFIPADLFKPVCPTGINPVWHTGHGSDQAPDGWHSRQRQPETNNT